MKMKFFAIAIILAVFVQGALFARGIVEERAAHEYEQLSVQAKTCIEAGDIAGAIPPLKRMYELKPDELLTVEYLGILYFSLPEERPALTNALFWFSEAEKRGSSKSDMVYYNLACIYSLKGDMEKAETEMNKAFALGFSNFEWMSQDDDLVNFRNGSLWKKLTDNYTLIEQYLTLFDEFVSTEIKRSITDRITFYSSLVTAFNKLAPDIPALHPLPLFYLASSYEDSIDYSSAEQNYIEAKTIWEETLGRNHPYYARSLNSMGSLYISMGEFAKAENCYTEAKTIREKTLGRDHPDYAASLNNLGILYKNMGDYVKAEIYYLEASAVWGKALGKESLNYAISLNNLGVLYDSMGEYERAESYFLEAITVWEKTIGREHPDYARALNNLGFLYYRTGDSAKAEIYYSEARAIQENVLGKEHPDYAGALDNLYALYLSKKEYIQALACKQEQVKLKTGLVNQNFSFQTEQQRNAYWNANSGSFESIYSLSFYFPVSKSNILNYDNALFSKGLLLRTTNAVRDSIYSSGDQTLSARFEELGRLRQQIGALRQAGRDKAYIKSLEDEAETMDKFLTQSSAAFREFHEDLAVNWQSVRDSLQAEEAAIEFVSFRLYEKEGWINTAQYAALVVKPDSEAPVWVSLCDEEALQEILGRAADRKQIDQTKIIYDMYGADLYSLVWKPLEDKLGNVKTIYYSPSGLLHKVAFRALPVVEDEDSLNLDDESDDDFDFLDLEQDKDRKRLADKYDLNLVSSTREVVHLNRNPVETTQITSAVLYGGLDYNADETAMRTAAQLYKKETVASAAIPPEGVTRGGAWAALPATRVEVQNIQNLLAMKNIPNTLYQDSLGNEESFKHLSGMKTGLIHLATHGFFLTDAERKRDDREQQRRGSTLRNADNPLLRSGVLLAGGNHAWTNNPVDGVDSGILTADKIADLNLLGAKLTVLSACQTGLGDVNNSEGVFGLQRAFKLAGVETLVMSLWEVDDDATAKLMSVFYNEWLFSGKSKQEAFNEAQKQVRDEYLEPFYWAAFVMMD